MLKEIFGSSSLLDLPLFVMAFFMLVFVAVLIRICARSRSPHYRAMSQMPLDLSEQAEERNA